MTQVPLRRCAVAGARRCAGAKSFEANQIDLERHAFETLPCFAQFTTALCMRLTAFRIRLLSPQSQVEVVMSIPSHNSWICGAEVGSKKRDI